MPFSTSGPTYLPLPLRVRTHSTPGMIRREASSIELSRKSHYTNHPTRGADRLSRIDHKINHDLAQLGLIATNRWQVAGKPGLQRDA